MPPTNTPEPRTNETPTPSMEDNTMLMGILAYLGPLVIVPYLTSKNVPFVYFHIKQGVVLFAFEILVYVAVNFLVYSFLFMFIEIIPLIKLALLALTIVGIVNVVQKQEKPLPVIGSLAKHVTF